MDKKEKFGRGCFEWKAVGEKKQDFRVKEIIDILDFIKI